MTHTLFIRRYPDGLSITAVWEPDPQHRGYGYVGELALTAARGEEFIGSERHHLREDNLSLREQRTTSLTNGFVVRARQAETASCH